MFGNPRGWAISAAVAVVYVGLFALVERGGAVSRPSALTTAGAFGMGPVSVPPIDALTAGRVGRESAEAVRVLRREVEAGRGVYERFMRSPGLDAELLRQITVVDRVAGLALAQGGGAVELFPAEDAVSYAPPEDRPVEAARLAGASASRVALAMRARKRPEEARRIWEGVLVLGATIAEGRQSFAELSAGLGLMSEAAGGLALLAKDAADDGWRARAEKLTADLAALNAQIAPVFEAVSTIDPGVMSRHNGDIPVLATASKERVWRVEATLKLGRMKYDVGRTGTPADQRNARKLLRRLATDPDPAVACAAALGDALTLEDYRTLR